MSFNDITNMSSECNLLGQVHWILSLKASGEDSGPNSHISPFGLKSLAVDTNGAYLSVSADGHLGKQDIQPVSMNLEAQAFFRDQTNRGKSGLKQTSGCYSFGAGLFYSVL